MSSITMLPYDFLMPKCRYVLYYRRSVDKSVSKFQLTLNVQLVRHKNQRLYSKANHTKAYGVLVEYWFVLKWEVFLHLCSKWAANHCIIALQIIIGYSTRARQVNKPLNCRDRVLQPICSTEQKKTTRCIINPGCCFLGCQKLRWVDHTGPFLPRCGYSPVVETLHNLKQQSISENMQSSLFSSLCNMQQTQYYDFTMLVCLYCLSYILINWILETYSNIV